MKIHKIKNYKKFAISTSIIVVILLITLGFIFGNTKSEKYSETLSLETANAFNENQEDDDSLVIVKEDIEEMSEEVLDAQDESEENEENKEDEKQDNNNDKKDNKQKNNNNSNQTSSGSQYYIKVNYGANVVTVYKKDDNGNYTIPIKAMICSTGTATPKSGVYSVKTKWTWGALFGNVYGHYVTKIVGNILFHSVPYLSNDPSTLEYWEYDKLGTSASMGCVRLKIADAKWIFDYMPYGTPVEFYSDSNPGPLGKPGAQKISGNEQCRGWDPTDPDSRNPWHNVSQKEEKKEEPKQENNNDKTNNTATNNTIKNDTNNNTSNNTSNTNTTQNNTQDSNKVNTNSTVTNTNTTTTNNSAVNTNTTTNINSVSNSNTVNTNTSNSNTKKNTNSNKTNTTNSTNNNSAKNTTSKTNSVVSNNNTNKNTTNTQKTI